LAELKKAEYHLARNRELIEEHKERVRRLTAGALLSRSFSDELLSLLERCEKAFQAHANLIKRELEGAERNTLWTARGREAIASSRALRLH
jgi:hypothetical protein